MRNCNNCGRPLNEGENNLCPACKSTESHKKKTWTEIIMGVVVVVGGIALKVITAGKDDGKA